jgi:hypothetical protein
MSWFEQLFGFPEVGGHSSVASHDNYLHNQSNFYTEIDESTGLIFLVSRVNQKKYCVGSFECMSLSQLRHLRTELIDPFDTSAEALTTYSHIAVDDILGHSYN